MVFRSLNRWKGVAIAAILLQPLFHAACLATPEIVIPMHEPSNLFQAGQPVRVEGLLNEFEPGDGEVVWKVTDYFGQEVASKTVPARVVPGEHTTAVFESADLQPGYYLFDVKASIKARDGTLQNASGSASFGVAPLVHRTAREAREGGYKFGVKKWNFGVAAWQGNKDWSEDRAVRGCASLGLQWTRELFNLTDQLGTVDLIKNYPMNVVLKVERFPAQLFDEAKYGKREDWEKKYGRGAWSLKTLPKEGPYKEWLASQIALIPPEQNVFEVWNEPWDKMSPEDFAVLCGWVTEVILKSRPDAIIGPNLLGDTSPYQFDARLIKAGGMKGMKMVALHPYGNSEDRGWLRDYRKWLREQTGIDPQIYITEFGSHSTPQGPAARSERDQAQREVRQALALYAEGVTALMPHTMGTSEQNPTYIEDWFGLFRFSGQPKPVLMAYANAAHQVDGSRFVGDLWYGPEVEAMLFEKKGVYTIALQTRGAEKEIQIDPGVAEVDVANMVGAVRRERASNGKVRLKIDADATYVVRVSPDLAKQASMELRPDRWPQPAKPPRNTRIATKMKAPPVFDGKLEDWKNATQIALLNPKVNSEDASGTGYVAWDDKNLYVAIQIRDNEILNTKPLSKLYQHDSLELFISTEPRDTKAGYGPHDHQFFVAPTSAENTPVFGQVADREAGKVEPVNGAQYFAGKVGAGWVAEVAIPLSALPDFKPEKGATLALEMRVNDADTAHERFKIDPIDGNVLPPDPTAWSLLKLQE